MIYSRYHDFYAHAKKNEEPTGASEEDNVDVTADGVEVKPVTKRPPPKKKVTKKKVVKKELPLHKPDESID